ncbi:CobW family GTP-binding protein [Paractinoplanes lichenicola]|uniref:GTP-binding protein n=1 Tax=Paractinoplanes lichenicola TaxID=2802976 RepID=A0ABS1VZL6_9ACTN|nr:GTP-binding protein [Actinoplanes lichenicola]MBL7259873.1 GTP-binding protein [Actinoplanes lichenicola]
MTDPRPRVTVLAGFSSAATAAAARVLLLADPALLLLAHDLSGVREGVVRRSVRDAARVLENAQTRLVHGCVSCTLREDVLPALVRLARERPGRDIVLALPSVVEPEALAAACAASTEVSEAVRFDSFVTVVEAATFLDDLSSIERLRDRGLHSSANDRRRVADVVSRQVEFADTLLVWDRPGNDAFAAGRVDSLLHRLAPWAVHVRVGSTPSINVTALAASLRHRGRHDPGVPGILARAMCGFPIGIHDPEGEYGVNAMLFRSRRPFHPERLHDALASVAGEALRGRGQAWIASQPDTVIGWESAGGGIVLGGLGRWLAALSEDRRHEASGLRRLAADVDWDPYYGDRQTVLSLVGLGLDVPRTTRLLTACLLDDGELSTGEEAWRHLPDPFAGLLAPATAESD